MHQKVLKMKLHEAENQPDQIVMETALQAGKGL
jgi:hypothetical protein